MDDKSELMRKKRHNAKLLAEARGDEGAKGGENDDDQYSETIGNETMERELGISP